MLLRVWEWILYSTVLYYFKKILKPDGSQNCSKVDQTFVPHIYDEKSPKYAQNSDTYKYVPAKEAWYIVLGTGEGGRWTVDNRKRSRIKETLFARIPERKYLLLLIHRLSRVVSIDSRRCRAGPSASPWWWWVADDATAPGAATCVLAAVRVPRRPRTAPAGWSPPHQLITTPLKWGQSQLYLHSPTCYNNRFMRDTPACFACQPLAPYHCYALNLIR